MQPCLVPVSGFLGAGKTTLILAAARLFKEKGLKCAAILNDQGDRLVDTAYVREQGLAAAEVTGACFCCRFSDLIAAAEQLRTLNPDVIFAEPVGSCTDLSATILQPLKREFCDRYRVAPLTVLVDPERVRELTQPDVKFLFDQQLAEADLVAFTKCDLHQSFPSLSAENIRYLSAKNGAGIAAWLDEILFGVLPVGRAILDIDYEHYARAEAALGWLNWSAALALPEPVGAPQLVGPFMEQLQRSLRKAGAEIAHLKILDQTSGSYLKAAVTSSRQSEPMVEGDLTASPTASHQLTVNLRAVLPSAELEKLFLAELPHLRGERSNEHFQCFSPAPPKPEHRFMSVVW